jgi:glycosyltransferase involved in cell wall biosynthesis
MKISFLLDGQFPYGMASANRAHLYAKGLIELGNDVTILIPRATEKPGRIRNRDVSGIHEGVKFRYAYESIIRKSFLGRRIQNLISFMNSFLLFIRLKPDIILIAASNFKYILLGKTCSLLTGAKLVREKSEVPFYKLEKLTRFRKFRIKSEFRLFDGMIVISNELKDFFSRDMKLNLKMIEVPILVETNSISKNGIPARKANLVYTGSLLEHKDGVTTIIRAFARILPDHPGLKLIMTGNIEGSVSKKEILDLIQSLKLGDNVLLPGYISKDELNELTTTASVLLLAKPLNRQNRYNMATKIGEYLMTGRPAVISNVDPVCSYLSHRENICITDPDELRIAEEIEFLLENPLKADEIGSSGRGSVVRLFDYKIHAARMDDFFRNL